MISVISTNYNNNKYLKEMVASVQRQSFKNWELIVVDDGSTDESQETLIQLANEDDRIKPIFLKENSGAAFALNMGITIAEGDIIGRLDSDDALEPNALAEMNVAHMKYPESSIITSQMWACDEKLNKIQFWNYRRPDEGISLIHECTIGHFATFKKSCLSTPNAVDSRLRRAVDRDLYLRLEEAGPIIFIEKPLYLYRQHSQGISQGSNGQTARHWSRFVILCAHLRRKFSGRGQLLSRFERRNQTYIWFITELRTHEMRLTKWELIKYSLKFNIWLAWNPKFYFRLFVKE